MARWTSVGVGGFKSIQDLQPLSLGAVNVFIGANGAGKSNLISFFRMLASIPSLRLQEFVGRAGGANTLLYYGAKQTPGMWVNLGFSAKTGDGKYLFNLKPTATDSLIFHDEVVNQALVSGGHSQRSRLGSGHNETLLMEGEHQFRDVRDLLAGIQIFHFEDTSETASIRRGGYVEDNRYLHNNGGNLAAFLLGLRIRQPLYYQRNIAAIQQVAPFFDDFVLTPQVTDPNSIRLNWKDRYSEHLFGPHQLSDGTLRAMALTALLAQPETELPGLVVLDEPEIGLHPHAIGILAALVKSASIHGTIILATQSPALVNEFSADDVVTVTRTGAGSKFERRSSESLAIWLDEYAVGDLWERNLLAGGTPSQ